MHYAKDTKSRAADDVFNAASPLTQSVYCVAVQAQLQGGYCTMMCTEDSMRNILSCNLLYADSNYETFWKLALCNSYFCHNYWGSNGALCTSSPHVTQRSTTSLRTLTAN
eukprot:6190302-Pleurochrysis_carterae.AAC.1